MSICQPCEFALQTIGVLGVVLYHIWPSEFGNGLLGVDVLLIVFGFSLTRQLLSPPINAANSPFFAHPLRQLFASQFRRIVPLYLFTICATLVASFALIYERGELQRVLQDAQWALAFCTNVQLDSVDWTKELIGLPQTQPFFHLWATAVQVQFLLLFLPPLALCAKHSNVPHRGGLPSVPMCCCCCLVLATSASLLCWLFWPARPIAMGWLCSRLWQPLLGASAALIGSAPRLDGALALPPKWAAHLAHLAVSLLGACVSAVLLVPASHWPTQHFHPSKTALALCLSAKGATMLAICCSLLKAMSSSALAQWICRHLAELPYILFLVHQPIAVLLKRQLGVSLFGVNDGLLALGLIVFGAILVHLSANQLFHFVAHKRPSTFALLILLGYAVGILAGMAPEQVFVRQSGKHKTAEFVPIFDVALGKIRSVPAEVENVGTLLAQLQRGAEHRLQLAERLNQGSKWRINEMLKNSFTFDLQTPGNTTDDFTRMSGLQTYNADVDRIYERKLAGNGSKRILLVGNSHAQVIWKEAEQVLRPAYRILHVFVIPACMPIFGNDTRSFYGISCARMAQSLVHILAETRPDVLLLVFKWYDDLQLLPLESPHQDPTLVQMRAFLAAAQQSVRDRIYFPEPSLRFGVEIAYQLAKQIWQGAGPLHGLNKNRTTHIAENRWNFVRLEHLRRDCPKCTFFDFADHFCDVNGDICHAYDPNSQLAYFSDSNHLSHMGRLSLVPFLRKTFAETNNE